MNRLAIYRLCSSVIASNHLPLNYLTIINVYNLLSYCEKSSFIVCRISTTTRAKTCFINFRLSAEGELEEFHQIIRRSVIMLVDDRTSKRWSMNTKTKLTKTSMEASFNIIVSHWSILLLLLATSVFFLIIYNCGCQLFQWGCIQNKHWHLPVYNQEKYSNKRNSRQFDLINLKFGTKHANREPKKILFWTKYYAYKKLWPLDKDFPFGKSCRFECKLTHDKSLYNKSDAVVFHAWTIFTETLPSWRVPDQQWVLYNQEPPFRLYGAHFNATSYNGMFNWTMSYKTDSDIHVPYGNAKLVDARTRNNKSISLKPLKIFGLPLENRKKKAIVLIRRCNETLHRVRFAKELGMHYPVDFYGRCFGHSICNDPPKYNATDCLLKFIGTYRYDNVLPTSSVNACSSPL